MRAAGGFRLKAAMSLGLLFATAVTFLACSRAPAAIEHTVIILQENHTFDNYFRHFSRCRRRDQWPHINRAGSPAQPHAGRGSSQPLQQLGLCDPSHGCRQNGRLRPDQRRVGPYTQATEQ